MRGNLRTRYVCLCDAETSDTVDKRITCAFGHLMCESPEPSSAGELGTAAPELSRDVLEHVGVNHPSCAPGSPPELPRFSKVGEMLLIKYTCPDHGDVGVNRPGTRVECPECYCELFGSVVDLIFADTIKALIDR